MSMIYRKTKLDFCDCSIAQCKSISSWCGYLIIWCAIFIAINSEKLIPLWSAAISLRLSSRFSRVILFSFIQASRISLILSIFSFFWKWTTKLSRCLRKATNHRGNLKLIQSQVLSDRRSKCHFNFHRWLINTYSSIGIER